MLTFLKKLLGLSAKATIVFKGGPLNIQDFNEKFVAGNKALAAGNTEGLNKGISLFIESLSVAGPFAARMKSAIEALYCALSHHDRADTKGPWNRDLSGYGVMSWKNDLYDRDEALQRAWPYINSVNEELKKEGLGWR
jgi:hypothetical protein